MTTELTSRLTSRKFLLTVATIAFAILGIVTNHLTYDSAMGIVQGALYAYLVAEGAPDFVTRFFDAKAGK